MLDHAIGMVSGAPPYGHGEKVPMATCLVLIVVSSWTLYRAVLRIRDDCSVLGANHPRQSCTRHAEEVILVALLIPDRPSPAHQPIHAAIIRFLHLKS